MSECIQLNLWNFSCLHIIPGKIKAIFRLWKLLKIKGWHEHQVRDLGRNLKKNLTEWKTFGPIFLKFIYEKKYLCSKRNLRIFQANHKSTRKFTLFWLYMIVKIYLHLQKCFPSMTFLPIPCVRFKRAYFHFF